MLVCCLVESNTMRMNDKGEMVANLPSFTKVVKFLKSNCVLLFVPTNLCKPNLQIIGF